MGPKPIQLVVVMAVKKAVSAATTTFTAISIKRFFAIRFQTFFVCNLKAEGLTSHIRLQTSNIVRQPSAIV